MSSSELGGVSVVTVTVAEKEAWLETLLESLEAQTVRPAEVVCAVDTKRTQERVPRPKQRCFPVRVSVPWSVKHEKRQHELTNWAVGLVSAETEFLLVVDDDFPFVSETSLEQMLSLARPDRVVVPEKYFEVCLEKADWDATERSELLWSHDVEEVRSRRGGLHPSAWKFWYEPHRGCLFEEDRRGHELSCLTYHGFWCGHPKLVPKDAFQRVGGLDSESYPHYWHCDTDMALRLLAAGVEPVAVAGLEVAHLSHPRGDYYRRKDANTATLAQRFPDWEKQLFGRAYRVERPIVRTDALGDRS